MRKCGTKTSSLGPRIGSLQLTNVAEPTDLKEPWRSPLQRHIDTQGNYLFTLIQICIFNNDTKKECYFQFKNENLTAKEVCHAVAEKEKVLEGFRSHFRLWVFGKNLELQLLDDILIFDFIQQWNKL